MQLLADLVLALSENPGRACAQSAILIARARGGVLELLSAAAWARALGYAPEELSGKSLRGLIPLEQPAAARLLAELLDAEDARSLEVTLRCKNERRKSFHFHRRFDPCQDAMYVVADELADAHRAPLSP